MEQWNGVWEVEPWKPGIWSRGSGNWTPGIREFGHGAVDSKVNIVDSIFVTMDDNPSMGMSQRQIYHVMF